MAASSPLVVLVTGGRDYPDRAKVFAQLDFLATEYADRGLCVIEGGATGADQWAREWRADRRALGRSYIANWARYPRGAGILRNGQMLREGKPELVLAYPGGKGTAHMVGIAKAAGVPVVLYDR